MLFLLCVCWFALAAAWSSKPYALEDVRLHFERFIEKHNKHYSNENEKQARFEIFKNNLKTADYINEKSDHAVFGITKFMDMTQEEFLRSYTGLAFLRDDDHGQPFNDGCDLLTDSDVPDAKAPASFDWREHNVVTRVKDQTQQCGSCYAFSATGNIEGQYAIKYKNLIELSEQQIVDCGRMLWCYGGLPSLSFRALINLGGAMSEADYPYIARNSDCKFDKSKVRVKLSNCYRYNLTSQDKVKQLLYQNGPVSIGKYGYGIAAAAHEFQKYVKGIISDDFCGNYSVNHAVLLVGYGTENGKDYWIVKNSWSDGFGEDGYFRMQRGEGASSCKMLNDKMAMSIIL